MHDQQDPVKWMGYKLQCKYQKYFSTIQNLVQESIPR